MLISWLSLFAFSVICGLSLGYPINKANRLFCGLLALFPIKENKFCIFVLSLCCFLLLRFRLYSAYLGLCFGYVLVISRLSVGYVSIIRWLCLCYTSVIRWLFYVVSCFYAENALFTYFLPFFVCFGLCVGYLSVMFSYLSVMFLLCGVIL